MTHISDKKMTVRISQLKLGLNAAVVHISFSKAVPDQNNSFSYSRGRNGLRSFFLRHLWQWHDGVRRILGC